MKRIKTFYSPEEKLEATEGELLVMGEEGVEGLPMSALDIPPKTFHAMNSNRAPSESDDSTLKFSTGSLWCYRNLFGHHLYVCLSAEEGCAQWMEIDNSGLLGL